MDGRVADYNVDAYLSGSLEEVDTDYLASLSPEVLPALRRLYEAEPSEYLAAQIGALESAQPGGWTEWSLCLPLYS